MLELAPSVRVWNDGDERILFSTLTGRWIRIAAAALDPLSPGSRLRLERLGLLEDPDPTSWVVARHRRTLFFPARAALWAPDASRPTAGGPTYRAIPSDPLAVAVWQATNDARTVRDIADRVGRTVADVLEVLARWTQPEVQAVQLRPRPPHPRDPGLLELAGPRRPPNVRTADQHGPDGATALGAWHDRIATGSRHFDDVEVTVAHALALGHPALDGQPFGERLRRCLGARGFPVDGPIVEVGCGDGELAAAFSGSPYLRLDRSLALLRTQAIAAPGTAGVLADAVALPLRDRSVACLLCNEVLADLPAAPSEAPNDEVDARLRQYDLAPLPAGTWHNLGAWKFVEEVARVLAPGGAAYLSEFGSPDEHPDEATQLDHPEVSIRFSSLETIARAQGLEAETVRLDDLLGVALSGSQLTRASFVALRAAFPTLEARAYTPETLSLPEPVEGLQFGNLADDGPGPRITRFYALLLRRAAIAHTSPAAHGRAT